MLVSKRTSFLAISEPAVICLGLNLFIPFIILWVMQLNFIRNVIFYSSYISPGFSLNITFGSSICALIALCIRYCRYQYNVKASLLTSWVYLEFWIVIEVAAKPSIAWLLICFSDIEHPSLAIPIDALISLYFW